MRAQHATPYQYEIQLIGAGHSDGKAFLGFK
jgi:hypothetical protein